MDQLPELIFRRDHERQGAAPSGDGVGFLCPLQMNLLIAAFRPKVQDQK
jgi:hypothetical protein